MHDIHVPYAQLYSRIAAATVAHTKSAILKVPRQNGAEHDVAALVALARLIFFGPVALYATLVTPWVPLAAAAVTSKTCTGTSAPLNLRGQEPRVPPLGADPLLKTIK
jgi:hypothetical protein